MTSVSDVRTLGWGLGTPEAGLHALMVRSPGPIRLSRMKRRLKV